MELVERVAFRWYWILLWLSEVAVVVSLLDVESRDSSGLLGMLLELSLLVLLLVAVLLLFLFLLKLLRAFVGLALRALLLAPLLCSFSASAVGSLVESKLSQYVVGSLLSGALDLEAVDDGASTYVAVLGLTVLFT